MFKKIWNDPVWSKVISSIIVAILFGIVSYLWSVLNKIDYSNLTRAGFISYLKEVYAKSFFVFIGFSISIMLSIYSIVIVFIKLSIASRTKNLFDRIKIHLLQRGGHFSDHNFLRTKNPSTFFSYRITDAFPGLRGLLWVDNSETALRRLEIILRKPLSFSTTENDVLVTYHPIWWFRGFRNMPIDVFMPLQRKFFFLGKSKILLDIHELVIDRMAVYHDSAREYMDFIYLEFKPEKPTGLYEDSKETKDHLMIHRGYSYEEYGIFNGRKVTREEYDDGGTIIRGKPVRTYDTQLRMRFTSRYNLLISSVSSPYNSDKFDKVAADYLNAILRSEKPFDDLFKIMMTLSKSDSKYRP